MLHAKRWRWIDASLLHEVPEEGRAQEPEADHNEEQEACDSGRVPNVWHEGIQNRQGLEPAGSNNWSSVEAGYSAGDASPLFLASQELFNLVRYRPPMAPADSTLPAFLTPTDGLGIVCPEPFEAPPCAGYQADRLQYVAMRSTRCWVNRAEG